MKNKTRLNNFLMDKSQDSLDKSLVYKHFIYKALQDVENCKTVSFDEQLGIKMDMIYAIRFIYCTDMGIDPKCIKISFEDDLDASTGTEGTVAYAGKTFDLEDDYKSCFARVVFSADTLPNQSRLGFAHSTAHEFRHIYQRFKNEMGEFSFNGSNKQVKYETELHKKWVGLCYDVSLCEIDANYSSLSDLLQWIDDVEKAGLEPAGGLQTVRTLLKKARAEYLKIYASNLAKISGFILLHPISLLTSTTLDRVMYDYRAGAPDSRFVFKRNVTNFLNGTRTVKSATKIIEEIEHNEKVTSLDFVKYCDSQVVLLAKRVGINPLLLGLILTDEGDDVVKFIDCKNAKEKRLLGCVKINVNTLRDLDGAEFSLRIKDCIQSVEQSEEFLKAVGRFKNSKRKRWQDRSLNEEMGEE